jgi:hypothetical protein
MAEMEDSKSRNHWIHIPTQLIVGSFCAYWWYWHRPVPSKAVLWLAGVAVIMALWEMRPIHKAGYLLLVICLMLIENRAIDNDRAQFAQDETSRRQEERQQFRAVLDNGDAQFKETMNQQSNEFNAMLTSLGRIAGLSEDSIANITGGDSFCLVNISPENGQVWLSSKGRYHIYEADVRVVDVDALFEARNNGTIADARSFEQRFPTLPIVHQGMGYAIGTYLLKGAKDYRRFNIFIYARNGVFTELLRLKRQGSIWVSATIVSVSFYDHKQGIPFSQIDKNFPASILLQDDDWEQTTKLPRLRIKQ